MDLRHHRRQSVALLPVCVCVCVCVCVPPSSLPDPVPRPASSSRSARLTPHGFGHIEDSDDSDTSDNAAPCTLDNSDWMDDSDGP